MSTLLGFVLASVAVALGFQVPQSGQTAVKYAALGSAENLGSQGANPTSFILPTLTALIFAVTTYLVAKRKQ